MYLSKLNQKNMGKKSDKNQWLKEFKTLPNPRDVGPWDDSKNKFLIIIRLFKAFWWAIPVVAILSILTWGFILLELSIHTQTALFFAHIAMHVLTFSVLGLVAIAATAVIFTGVDRCLAAFRHGVIWADEDTTESQIRDRRMGWVANKFLFVGVGAAIGMVILPGVGGLIGACCGVTAGLISGIGTDHIKRGFKVIFSGGAKVGFIQGFIYGLALGSGKVNETLEVSKRQWNEGNISKRATLLTAGLIGSVTGFVTQWAAWFCISLAQAFSAVVLPSARTPLTKSSSRFTTNTEAFRYLWRGSPKHRPLSLLPIITASIIGVVVGVVAWATRGIIRSAINYVAGVVYGVEHGIRFGLAIGDKNRPQLSKDFKTLWDISPMMGRIGIGTSFGISWIVGVLSRVSFITELVGGAWMGLTAGSFLGDGWEKMSPLTLDKNNGTAPSEVFYARESRYLKSHPKLLQRLKSTLSNNKKGDVHHCSRADFYRDYLKHLSNHRIRWVQYLTLIPFTVIGYLVGAGYGLASGLREALEYGFTRGVRYAITFADRFSKEGVNQLFKDFTFDSFFEVQTIREQFELYWREKDFGRLLGFCLVAGPAIAAWTAVITVAKGLMRFFQGVQMGAEKGFKAGIQPGAAFSLQPKFTNLRGMFHFEAKNHWAKTPSYMITSVFTATVVGTIYSVLHYFRRGVMTTLRVPMDWTVMIIDGIQGRRFNARAFTSHVTNLSILAAGIFFVLAVGWWIAPYTAVVAVALITLNKRMSRRWVNRFYDKSGSEKVIKDRLLTFDNTGKHITSGELIQLMKKINAEFVSLLNDIADGNKKLKRDGSLVDDSSAIFNSMARDLIGKTATEMTLLQMHRCLVDGRVIFAKDKGDTENDPARLALNQFYAKNKIKSNPFITLRKPSLINGYEIQIGQHRAMYDRGRDRLVLINEAYKNDHRRYILFPVPTICDAGSIDGGMEESKSTNKMIKAKTKATKAETKPFEEQDKPAKKSVLEYYYYYRNTLFGPRKNATKIESRPTPSVDPRPST